MYIFQNALKNIARNKGRNILLGTIIFAIIATTVVALLITNTSDRIIDEYKGQFGIEVTIERNTQTFVDMRSRGEASMGITVTNEQYIAFADSNLLQRSMIMKSALVYSETLTAIGQTGDLAAGNEFVIAPTMQLQGNNWDDFKNGHRVLTHGEMPTRAGEAVISEELAELNDISVGGHIRLYGTVLQAAASMGFTPAVYDFVVTGIYFCSAESLSTWGSTTMIRQNEVLTVSESIPGASIIARYYLNHPSDIDAFEQELREKGLHEIFDVITDENLYHTIVGPVEGMRGIVMTFMIVVLILGAIILILLSSIAIRERKYEIGVLRAMGMKKARVALGLWSEMVFITLLCLILGIGAGLLAAQPISNELLAQQSENTQNMQDVFFAGRDLGSVSRVVDDEPITEISILLGIDTIIQIVVISLVLASIAAFAAISRITKYEPIKILTHRN
ncbi:MAG: ABC transporter permease [Oscillospiraceae bacterium]|jgi:putative ABC transport system permease protein|nr:ABC transporter permease [Oscillospiraceae bacterium]